MSTRQKYRAKTKAKAKSQPVNPFTIPAFRFVVIAVVVLVLMAGSGFGYAAAQESHDNFCASCHTQPESTFYERSLNSVPVDLASMHKGHNTRCIDCHSAAGITGRISAELLGAHNAVLFYTNQAIQPAAVTRPIGNGNCLKCHDDVTRGQATQNNHFHLFLSRWQSVDRQAAGCVDCHQGHSTGGSSASLFLEQEPTVKVCESCHARLGDD